MSEAPERISNNDRMTVIIDATARSEYVRADLYDSLVAALKDPATVWASMLRGTIARPQALDHYEELKAKFEAIQSWKESVLAEVGQMPVPPEAYTSLEIGHREVANQWYRRAEHLAAKLVEAQSREAVMREALQHVLRVFKSMADRGAYPAELMPLKDHGGANVHYLGKQGWQFVTDALAQSQPHRADCECDQCCDKRRSAQLRDLGVPSQPLGGSES